MLRGCFWRTFQASKKILITTLIIQKLEKLLSQTDIQTLLSVEHAITNITRTPLDDVFNSQYKLINVSKNKIDNTINQTLMKNIDGQVERPVDISSYNTIVGNYHNISNSTRSIFNNVNSNIQPISKQSIVYAASWS